MKNAVFVSKDQSKNQTFESSRFFQILQNFERTFTVLDEKRFGRIIKIENCSLRLKRSIKKPNFWKFSFFSNSSELWPNIHRAWRKIFRQGYQNWKMQSSSRKINRKIKLLKVLVSFKFFGILNERLPCLTKNVSAGLSKLKIAVFVSKDQSKNKTFETSLFFNFFRTLTVPLPCLAKNFSAGISKLKNAVFVSRDQSKNQTSESSLFFFNFFRTSNEQLPCLTKNVSAGLSKLKIAVFVSKDQSKNQTFESSRFFQILQNFKRTFTVLGEKLFGRDIKIEKCSLRLKRSIEKSNFWKFSFLSNSSEFWTNVYRAWRKTFRQDYQNWKLQSSSQKINQKIKLLKLLFFSISSELWPYLYRAWQKTFRQGYQNWKMQSSSQEINQKTKLLKVLFFFSISSELRTNNYRARRKTFRQGYQNWKMQFSSQKINQKIKLLKVLFFSNSSQLWTNNCRAWRKSFRRGYQNWKMQSPSHKIKQKIKLLKNLFYFQILQNFEQTITVLGGKLFSRDIKIEKCSLRLERSIEKSKFWKFSFFSNSSELRTNTYRFQRKIFRQWYQNRKMQFLSQNINQKIKLLTVLFFQILHNFERTIAVLDEKVFGGDIKIEKCSLRLIRSNKKPNFWKFSFFSISSELRTNNYRARRKTFWQGYQNWKMQFSSQKTNQKIKLLKVLFFSNSSQLWTNNCRAWRKSFRRGYQNWKMQSPSHKIKQKIKLLKNLFYFQILQNFEQTITVLGGKLFGRDIKIEKCSLRLERSIEKSNFWKFSFFFKFFRTSDEHLPCSAENFTAVLSNLKNAVFVSKHQSKNQTSDRSLFSNSSQLWTNNCRAWRKSFRRGYQNWKMQSSSQKINKKTKLLKVLFFFKLFRTLTEKLPCLAKNFSAGISKLKIAVCVS